MKLITIREGCLRVKGMQSLYPDQEYIISDQEYQSFVEFYKTSGFEFMSDVEELEVKQWQHGCDAKTLLVWNTGRLGDQLWTTAIIRKIKSLNPQLLIDVVCHGTSEQIYMFNKDIRSYRAVPVLSNIIDQYDAVLFYDETVAKRTDAEQPNCYEILFNEAKIPFTREDCKPRIHIRAGDEQNAFLKTFEPENGDVFVHENFVLLGLASESSTRNLTADQWATIIKLLEELGKDIEDFQIFGLSHNGAGLEIQEQLSKYKFTKYKEMHEKLNLREIAALMRLSRLTITVDTAYVHLAGALDAPCVVFPSTVDPSKRFSTYNNLITVYKRRSCVHAPCYFKGNNFKHSMGEVIEIAPCFTPQRTQCDILKSLTINDFGQVIEAAMSGTHRLPEINPLPL